VIGVLYLKFFAQVAATVLSAIAAAMQAGPLSATAWVNVVVIGFGAIGVLGAGELPSGVWAHTKPIVAALSAAVVVIETSLAGGFTAATIVQALRTDHADHGRWHHKRSERAAHPLREHACCHGRLILDLGQRTDPVPLAVRPVVDRSHFRSG
jgi:hypothetical protein